MGGRDLWFGHDRFWPFPVVLVFVLYAFVAGFVDNISVVVRHTLVQLLTLDDKRGRVSAVNSLFIGTSNEMGGFDSRCRGELVWSRDFGGLRRCWHAAGRAGRGLDLAEIRKYGRLDSG